MAEFEGFAPGKSTKDCTDGLAWGTKSTLYSYIFKGNSAESDYPADACSPYYHGNAQIDNLKVNTEINGDGDINITGTVTATGASAAVKAFNIPHPSPGKEDKRLWHGCLEGPEYGVYVRGWLQNEKVITLPYYWPDLVDMNSITIQLTQIGYSQDLIIEKIEGTTITVKSGTGHQISCYYTVNATRKDVPQLQVEQDA